MSSFCILLVFINGFVWSTQSIRYDMEVLEIDYNVTTPDNIDMAWKVVRPSRGQFAVNGFVNFKQDANTDKTTFYADIYYSTNGMTYLLTAFRLPVMTLTDEFSNHYKNYLMDTVKECCLNAIDVEGEFVPPLTKRLMECDKCMFTADNFPTNMRLGYYKIIAVASGEIGFALTVLIKLEIE